MTVSEIIKLLLDECEEKEKQELLDDIWEAADREWCERVVHGYLNELLDMDLQVKDTGKAVVDVYVTDDYEGYKTIREPRIVDLVKDWIQYSLPDDDEGTNLPALLKEFKACVKLLEKAKSA